MKISWRKNLAPDSKPVQLGKKRERYLCAIQHPPRGYITVAQSSTTWATSTAQHNPNVSNPISGFDEYFMSLRPAPTLADCDTGSSKNRKSRSNCRNPWFREFWSHHFRCTFPDEKNDSAKSGTDETRICTGQEVLMKYEQEGLVPFVGKKNNWLAKENDAGYRVERLIGN